MSMQTNQVQVMSTRRQHSRVAQFAGAMTVAVATLAGATSCTNQQMAGQSAALKLNVTPQITAANTVIMRIVLENALPDFSRAVNGNPSINTQRADTQVQVTDGTTAVIGGILKTQETSTEDKTPGVSSIPLLGWLFKRTDNRNESQELLIFITPRIIRG